MKLYQVPGHTWVTPVEDAMAPPGAHRILRGEPVFFYHLDGMYSYCKDKQGNVVHLPANQEVIFTELK